MDGVDVKAVCGSDDVGRGRKSQASHLLGTWFVVRRGWMCFLGAANLAQYGRKHDDMSSALVCRLLQVVAGRGCKTARHSACLKQANTSQQGQNLQGRWAAG